MLVAPTSEFYIVSTVFFQKYREVKVVVTNCMSQFSMFVPTKATVKLANGNTLNSQGIAMILCHFTNCSIIYPVGPVYYCPSHPYNIISPGPIKFYVGFQKVTS